MSKYIPVEAEKWAEMVQAMALAADLMVENKRLTAENERLRKAGDAMADEMGLETYAVEHFEKQEKLKDAWLAAKEGGAK